MARWRQRQFLFLFFSSVCCHLHLALAWFLCTLNSRTPRIYMLMMVCWLTKLLQKDKYKKKKAHTHFGPGFNVALSGIMLRFMTTSHVYFQMNLSKKVQQRTNEEFSIREKNILYILFAFSLYFYSKILISNFCENRTYLKLFHKLILTRFNIFWICIHEFSQFGSNWLFQYWAQRNWIFEKSCRTFLSSALFEFSRFFIFFG